MRFLSPQAFKDWLNRQQEQGKEHVAELDDLDLADAETIDRIFDGLEARTDAAGNIKPRISRISDRW